MKPEGPDGLEEYNDANVPPQPEKPLHIQVAETLGETILFGLIALGKAGKL